MNDVSIVISVFGKALEQEDFYKSLNSSDISCLPKITIVNTETKYGFTGQDNVGVAEKYRLPEDRIIVCKYNAFTGSLRYVVQNITYTPYIITTEADFWLERRMEYFQHVEYFKSSHGVALINVMTRHMTKSLNKGWFAKHNMKHSMIDGYMRLDRNVPWHLYLTHRDHLIRFFDVVQEEITDSVYTNFCRHNLNKEVLTLDWREFALHMDREETVRRYPTFGQMYHRRCKRKKQILRKEDFIEI
jgi:hypothetical protein